MEPSRARMPGVQQQQHYSSFSASTPLVNQNIHPQRDMSHIGGVGAMATVGYRKLYKSQHFVYRRRFLTVSPPQHAFSSCATA